MQIFCSYADSDESWLSDMIKHLSLSTRQGLLTLWHHQHIAPGSNWQQIIDTHLETADVILLLVSSDFLASDYCYGVEMKRALERHQKGEAQMIPILIRPVDWKHAPFAHLPTLPINTKPLSLWEDKDAALAEVCETLRHLLEEKPSIQPAEDNTRVLEKDHVGFHGGIFMHKHVYRLLQEESVPITGKSFFLLLRIHLFSEPASPYESNQRTLTSQFIFA